MKTRLRLNIFGKRSEKVQLVRPAWVVKVGVTGCNTKYGSGDDSNGKTTGKKVRQKVIGNGMQSKVGGKKVLKPLG